MGFKKLMVAAALTAAAVVTPAAGASADTYTPSVLPTETHITVVADAPGEVSEITVWTTANSQTPPVGDIAVTLSAAGSTVARGSRAVAAAPLLSRTVHFTGTPVTFDGPALPAGRYIGTAAFTPSDPSAFLPSDGSTAFRLSAGGETNPGDDNGGLPNTGGPNMLWLVLGGALVVGGASSVAYARRRQPVTI